MAIYPTFIVSSALAHQQGKKSEAKKMLKNRLTLTIFGRFLEGNLN